MAAKKMANKMNNMPRPPKFPPTGGGKVSGGVAKPGPAGGAKGKPRPMPSAGGMRPDMAVRPGKPTTLPNRAPGGAKPAGPRPSKVKKFLQQYKAGMQ